jgi:thiamine-monophosphate kinase
MRIDQIGEAGVIRLIARAVRSRGRVRVGIGDDACVLEDGTVVTTDAYAEGVHFDRSYMSWEQVGARCACGAVSDVVAMGAKPLVVVVALALPGSTSSSSLRSLYRGIDRVCGELGCEVAGGDIVALDRMVITLTVVGWTARPKLRSGAKPGEGVYVTGSLGAAEAGRLVLAGRAGTRNRRTRHTIPPWAKSLVERHLCPMPRFRVAQALGPIASSMIDTSDGLATDAAHLAEMSDVKVVLASGELPLEPEVSRVVNELGVDLESFVLSAGEDYELLFTSRGPVPGMVKGVRVSRVGRVEQGAGLWLEKGGRRARVRSRGYDHMTKRRTIG